MGRRASRAIRRVTRGLRRSIRNAFRSLRDRTIDEWSGINAAEEEAKRKAEEEARLAAEEEAKRKAEEEQRKKEEEYKSRILKDQAGLESETASDTGDWSETGLGGVTVDTSASEVAPGIMEDTEDKMKKALRRFGKTKR